MGCYNAKKLKLKFHQSFANLLFRHNLFFNISNNFWPLYLVCKKNNKISCREFLLLSLQISAANRTLLFCMACASKYFLYFYSRCFEILINCFFYLYLNFTMVLFRTVLCSMYNVCEYVKNDTW